MKKERCRDPTPRRSVNHGYTRLQVFLPTPQSTPSLSLRTSFSSDTSQVLGSFWRSGKRVRGKRQTGISSIRFFTELTVDITKHLVVFSGLEKRTCKWLVSKSLYCVLVSSFLVDHHPPKTDVSTNKGKIMFSTIT